MTIRQRWHKGRERFYQVVLQKDLLGDWSLTCSWGSLHSRLGNYKHHAFGTQNEALELIEKITKRRMARGYELI